MRLLHAQLALETDKPPRLEIDVEGLIVGDINIDLFIYSDKALFFRVVAEDGKVVGGFLPLYEGVILWLIKAADIGHVEVVIRRHYGGRVEASGFKTPVENEFKKAVRAILATSRAS
jgi:hypothetical protein